MSNEEYSSTFVDQIVKRTLKNLSGHTDFDEQTLKNLKELAELSNLTDYEKVVKVLSTSE